MRELYVATREEPGADGEPVACDYYILIDQLEVEGGFACESYGVRINRRGVAGESVSIPNITISISRIDELMELLTNHFVTPTTAADVIADWL